MANAGQLTHRSRGPQPGPNTCDRCHRQNPHNRPIINSPAMVCLVPSRTATLTPHAPSKTKMFTTKLIRKKIADSGALDAPNSKTKNLATKKSSPYGRRYDI